MSGSKIPFEVSETGRAEVPDLQLAEAFKSPIVQRLYQLDPSLSPEKILPANLDAKKNVAAQVIDSLIIPVTENVHKYYGRGPLNYPIYIEDKEFPALEVDPETKRPLPTDENKRNMYQRLLAFERQTERQNIQTLTDFPVLEELRKDPETGQDTPLNSVRLHQELNWPSNRERLIPAQVEKDVIAGKVPFANRVAALRYAGAYGDSQLIKDMISTLDSEHDENTKLLALAGYTRDFLERSKTAPEPNSNQVLENMAQQESPVSGSPGSGLEVFYGLNSFPDLLQWVEACGNPNIQRMTALLLGTPSGMSKAEMFMAIKAFAATKLYSRD